MMKNYWRSGTLQLEEKSLFLMREPKCEALIFYQVTIIHFQESWEKVVYVCIWFSGTFDETC